MWKNLIYGGHTYDNFLIGECGEIKNTKTNHIYNPYINNSGYAVISLPMGMRGKVKSIRVHKALAETFIPNPNGYMVVHHKDNDKTNYSLDNLEWTTHKLNTQYHLQELSKQTPYFNNRKLTTEDAKFIRDNRGKLSYTRLAKMFNVSKPVIVDIMRGKTYNY